MKKNQVFYISFLITMAIVAFGLVAPQPFAMETLNWDQMIPFRNSATGHGLPCFLGQEWELGWFSGALRNH